MILWKEKNLVVTEVSVVENYPIILMLPVQENSYQQLLEFMQKFEESAINDLEKIALLLIIFPSSNSTLSPEDLNKNPKSLKTLNLLASYKHKHKKLSLKYLHLQDFIFSSLFYQMDRRKISSLFLHWRHHHGNQSYSNRFFDLLDDYKRRADNELFPSCSFKYQKRKASLLPSGEPDDEHQ